MRHDIPADIQWTFAWLLLATARAYVMQRIEYVPCVSSELPCWVWARGGDGRYGHAYFLGTRFKAHRFAYLAFRGRIPRGFVIDHRECDRPSCVSPHHTFACTQSKNIRRCFKIGRGRSPFLKKET